VSQSGSESDAQRLFSGAAQYYARYRPAYPAELYAFLLERVAVAAPWRLLDLGCGTGELTIPLSRQMAEVDAVDVSAEMIELARAKAARAGAGSIRWIVGRAEDFTAPPAQFDIVTSGAAFHWMDRRTLAARIMTWLRPGGVFGVVGVNSTWNGTEEWQLLAIQVLRKWLGERRRAGGGVFTEPQQKDADLLRSAGFRAVSETEFPVRHAWDLDSFLGYLYSTSFASLDVLGDRAEGFEKELRAVLLDFEPSGHYTETLRFRCAVGMSPSG
jgi:ubiquinone/menaquinone biosynthesis C-methylase UbiE